MNNYPDRWLVQSLAEVADRHPNSLVDGPFGSNLKTNEYTNEGVRLIQLQNIGDGVWLDENKKFTSEKKYKELIRHAAFPGDIAIAKMADPIARACIIPPVSARFLVVADCIKLTPDKAKYHSQYLVYAINDQWFRKQAEQRSTGTTRQRINLSKLKTLNLLVPPVEEQGSIAKLLSTTDEAIQRTEQLIVKLKAIKQGLLDDLLTLGLDESGLLRDPIAHPEQFKDSPLGRIPKEWDVTDLSRAAVKIQDGTHFSPKSKGGPFRYLTSRNIRFGYIDLSECGWIDEKEHNAIYLRCDVRCGDVLLTKDGVNTGNAAINTFQEPVSLLSSVAFVRCDGHLLDKDYLLQFFLSPICQQRFKDLMSGNAITRLTLQKIKSFSIPLPNISEQTRIGTSAKSCDNKINAEQHCLTKLKLIKKGLMHDLLTGKVRIKIDDDPRNEYT